MKAYLLLLSICSLPLFLSTNFLNITFKTAKNIDYNKEHSIVKSKFKKHDFLSFSGITKQDYWKSIRFPAILFTLSIIIFPFMKPHSPKVDHILQLYLLFALPFCPFVTKTAKKIQKKHSSWLAGGNATTVEIFLYLLSPFIFAYKLLKYYLKTTQE